MQRTALITGITGQDGSYLAELLLAKGYRVHGLVRRTSTPTLGRIEHLVHGEQAHAELVLHHGDMSDAGGLRDLLAEVEPDEVYNLAAQSHVRVSFEQPEYTADVTGLGVLRLLEALRAHAKRTDRGVRLYQAGSSEMFGAGVSRQTEESPFHPRSPYACAKVFAHHQVVVHREAYGLFACNGILFNHESPRRGEAFVTRKITRAATRIKLGLQQKLQLGNIEARRDWGFAGDYVEAMWSMLQQERPDDYVVATGRASSLREFLELAFGSLDLDWREHVELDPRHLRPLDVDHLEGDASKAERSLGWRSRTSLPELAGMMIESDMRLAERELALRDAASESAQR